MDLNDLTVPVALERILGDAQALGRKLNRKEVDVDIFLHSFLTCPTIGFSSICGALGLPYDELYGCSLAVIKSKRKNKTLTTNFSDELVRLFNRSYQLGRELYGRHDYIVPELIILALTKENIPKAFVDFFSKYPEYKSDLQKNILMHTKCILKDIHSDKRGIPSGVEGGEVSSEYKQVPMFEKNKILSQFATNVNIEASEGKFDSLIDFDNKVEELCGILCRKKKPNAILVGSPGVGKSSCVQILAQLIVDGKAPELLSDKVIYSLSLSSMVAGTEYRGQFEKRLEDFVNEVKKYNNIILFIDEIHTLVGAGGGTSTSLEASNMLKPALANGEISCIGATTPREYNLTIKKDAALERRFERVLIREPSKYLMEQIIPTLVESYSEFHSVEYSREFQENLVEYCDTFLPKRFYPDKAVDVVDQCGATAKVKFWEFLDEEDTGREKILSQARLGILPTQKELDEMQVGIDKWTDRINSKRPIVTLQDLKDYFQTKMNPTPSILQNDGDLLLDEVVSQKEGLRVFIDKAVESSLAVNNIHNNFLFYGPQKCGKSFTVDKIRGILNRGGATVYHYSGVEFNDSYSHSKINGINQDSLCERVILCPNSVVIIDDADKITNQSCISLFSQILRDQKMQMLNGELADFTSCYFIFVSGVKAGGKLGYGDSKISNFSNLDSSLLDNIHYKIELKKLDKRDFSSIVKEKLLAAQKRLEKQGDKFSFSEEDIKKISILENFAEINSAITKKLINK